MGQAVTHYCLKCSAAMPWPGATRCGTCGSRWVPPSAPVIRRRLTLLAGVAAFWLFAGYDVTLLWPATVAVLIAKGASA